VSRSRSPKTPTTRTGSTPISKVSTVAATPSGNGDGTALSIPYRERGLVGKQRKMAFKIMQLREEGLSREDIAKQLGYHANSVSRILNMAGKRGWLTTPDIEDHLNFITSHKIVRNIDKALDKKEGLSLLQQEMTIAAAKGRGLFKVHETGKGLVAPQSLILSLIHI
jgi:hypothetical protein